jgi:hypothetical protein
VIFRLCLLSLLACAACRASDDPSQILQRIDATILGHLNKAMNYLCVQTVERSYFDAPRPSQRNCGTPDTRPAGKLMARDRLRLDVAVSRGGEIYSWHADNKFSSSLIDDVVRRGPIGSGGFVGFLENVFGQRGVHFRYKGREMANTAEVFSFDYSVPLSASRYEIGAPDRRKLVAFHGSFSAYVASDELASLTVLADQIPRDIGICSARNEMTYQLVPVAGNELLLPRVWVLGLSTAEMSTESRSEYTGCREFAGETTIHFHNLDDVNAPVNTAPTRPAEELPGGLTLRVRLRTPIDGRRSYAGDPVEGELLTAVRAGKHVEAIPRGATLHGVITRLEDRYKPWSHFFLGIQFESMRSGDRTFVLRARAKPSPDQIEDLYWIYGPQVSTDLINDVKGGLFVFASRHLKLNSRFSAEWVTEPLDASR